MMTYEKLGRMLHPDYYRIIMTKRVSRVFDLRIKYAFPSYSSDRPDSLPRVQALSKENGIVTEVLIGQKTTVNVIIEL